MSEASGAPCLSRSVKPIYESEPKSRPNRNGGYCLLRPPFAGGIANMDADKRANHKLARHRLFRRCKNGYRSCRLYLHFD